MSKPAELVTVAAYALRPEAESSRTLLGRSGIRAVLIVPGHPDAPSGFGIGVPHDDVAKAVEILRVNAAAATAGAKAEALAEDEGDVACIACGARIPEYLERCPACGWTSA